MQLNIGPFYTLLQSFGLCSSYFDKEKMIKRGYHSRLTEFTDIEIQAHIDTLYCVEMIYFPYILPWNKQIKIKNVAVSK